MRRDLGLFFTLVGIVVVLGVVAAWLAARLAGGPRRVPAVVVPVLVGFGALGLLGHSMGVRIGPTVPLWGFDVALLGDVVIGFGFALAAALAQAGVVRAVRRRRPAP